MKSFKLVSPFYVVIMPEKSNNVPSNIDFSAIVAASLRIARATNNPCSFSTAIELLITLWAGIRFPLTKYTFFKKFFNKHQRDFNNICKSKEEHEDLVS